MELGTYLVTGEAHSAGRSTVEVVAAATAGGVDVVQLREKAMPVRERYDLGRRIREMTAEAGVPLVVNDRVDLALALDADGVHLGDDDLPVTVAREQLGPDAIICRSVSTAAAARGAVYGTDSKDTDSDIGLDPIRAIDDTVDIPFVGIGGVTPTNAGDVVAAGADGVAVVSAITRADDPEAATRDLSASVATGLDRQ